MQTKVVTKAAVVGFNHHIFLVLMSPQVKNEEL
jgi:hypothetical protein